jgi:hypothetical protein
LARVVNIDLRKKGIDIKDGKDSRIDEKLVIAQELLYHHHRLVGSGAFL